MALNRIPQLAFLRNKEIYKSKKEAKEGLKNAAKAHSQDGSLILARYTDDTDDEIKTLVGVVYSNDDLKSISIFECDEIIVDGKNDNGSDEINDSPYGKKYKDYLKELSKLNIHTQ